MALAPAKCLNGYLNLSPSPFSMKSALILLDLDPGTSSSTFLECLIINFVLSNVWKEERLLPNILERASVMFSLAINSKSLLSKFDFCISLGSKVIICLLAKNRNSFKNSCQSFMTSSVMPSVMSFA